jgi:hypothetical protein
VNLDLRLVAAVDAVDPVGRELAFTLAPPLDEPSPLLGDEAAVVPGSSLVVFVVVVVDDCAVEEPAVLVVAESSVVSSIEPVVPSLAEFSSPPQASSHSSGAQSALRIAQTYATGATARNSRQPVASPSSAHGSRGCQCGRDRLHLVAA